MIIRFVMAAGVAAILTACGGGSDSGSPLASSDTFPLKTAFQNVFNDVSTAKFSITGTAPSVGAVISGTGSATRFTPTNGVFEGIDVRQKAETVSALLTATLTSNGKTNQSSVNETTTYSIDKNGLPVGEESANIYLVTNGVANIPQTVRVGDFGVVMTQDWYTRKDKSFKMGTKVTSYSIEADTGSTALLKVTVQDKNNLNVNGSTSIINYRITPSGGVSLISAIGKVGPDTLNFIY